MRSGARLDGELTLQPFPARLAVARRRLATLLHDDAHLFGEVECSVLAEGGEALSTDEVGFLV